MATAGASTLAEELRQRWADYERPLGFEAGELGGIVDLVRRPRQAQARLYAKHELPFITGVRRPLADILAELP